MTHRWVLRTDGGARGNPGPAGAGYVLEDRDGNVVCSGGRYLGETTNNVAEYRALLWGLDAAGKAGVTHLQVRADSQLMVRQVNGEYRVKNSGLAPLHAEAVRALARFASVEVIHVPRYENHAADELANAAMDRRGDVGDPAADDGCPPRLFE